MAERFFSPNIAKAEKAGVYRAAIDAAVDRHNGLAILPNDGEMSHFPLYEKIGMQFGPIQIIGIGSQSTPAEGMLTDVLLGANEGQHGPDHQLAFFHGSQKELKNHAVVEIVQQCPGEVLNLDCGCAHRRDEAVKRIVDADTDAGVLVTLGLQTQQSERVSIARNMLEAVGVTNVNHITPESDYADCSLRKRIDAERNLKEVNFASDGHVFIKTHDMNVTVMGGHPARLIIFEEPPTPDKRGYSQKTKYHHVLVYGNIHNAEKPPIARYHSSCVTAEHGGNACDCHLQLQETISEIIDHGSGVIIHSKEEGMGLGAHSKFAQTLLTIPGEADIYEARRRLEMPKDVRTFGLIGVVRDVLNLQRVQLFTGNLKKIGAFEYEGIEVIPVQHKADLSILSKEAAADALAKIQGGHYHNYLADRISE